jgi:GNAT superfamily N-acetyltransferase
MDDSITFRRGTTADSYTVFALFEETFADLAQRMGHTEPTSWADPDELAKTWRYRRSLYEHLAETADQFWLAKQKGEAVGFARSLVHGDVRELTEFFVRPDVQSSSIGRELLARAFPNDGQGHRLIIATTDLRAPARYLKAGVYPRFPIYYFWRLAEPVSVETDLEFVPMRAGEETAVLVGDIDAAVLSFRRDSDHRWLQQDRQGYLYYRHGQLVGYGYMGPVNGPFALLASADMPAALAHAENEAAAAGRKNVGFEVPMINKTAVTYLLQRGFRMDDFITLWMCDRPFGKLENYIITSPPFFL